MTDGEEFIVFGSPDIRDAEIQEVVETMRSGWLGTGPRTARFEKEFAAYVGAPHASAVNSCTAALHLSLLAAGVGPGDEVITTPLTFVATVNAIVHTGATPVLADIDPVTLNIDPAEVARRITPRTRAIVPVHFAGRPCDMDSLQALRKQHNLLMVEDCAHAVETEYRGRRVGTFGDFGCYSFYVTKNITTGEGGMIVTQRGEDADKVKILALHGMNKDAWKRFSDAGYRHYYVDTPGFKYNMMDLQAAIGIHQLRRIDEMWERRRHVWDRYNAAFADLPLRTPAAPDPDTRHAYHLYTLILDQDAVARDEFLNRMTLDRVGVGVHYLSVPEHPYYQRAYGWSSSDWPVAESTGRQIVSIPISSKLTDPQIERIIAAVRRNIFREAGTRMSATQEIAG
ncbi:MAG TPA: DegT/DnrJ/EryC1/StrS aminotransferase family protein [Longimicrobiales bacterium]